MALPKTIVVIGLQPEPTGWSMRCAEGHQQVLHAGIGMTRERHGGDVLGPTLTVTADTSLGQSGTSNERQLLAILRERADTGDRIE